VKKEIQERKAYFKNCGDAPHDSRDSGTTLRSMTMDGATQAGTARRTRPQGSGYRSVPNSKPVMDAINDLVHLHRKKEDASDTYTRP